jgi:predicted RNase H-like HicB family nuclease
MMTRLFIWKSASGPWLAESPSLPGCYFFDLSSEKVLQHLRSQIRAAQDGLKQEESELLIIAL